jgi:hypothetical protein
MWGSPLVDAGDLGHINADSGIGEWPEGVRLLASLIREEQAEVPLWEWPQKAEEVRTQRELKR